MKVKISDIVDAFELQNDELHYYVNIETGEVTSVQDDYARLVEDKVDLEDHPEWEQQVIKEAQAVADGLGDIYLELPSQRELNEYQMMVEFIEDLPNSVVAEDLAGAIRGKSAFRRFKDGVIHWGVDDEWYKFRDTAYARAAITWCEENEIPYEER